MDLREKVTIRRGFSLLFLHTKLAGNSKEGDIFVKPGTVGVISSIRTDHNVPTNYEVAFEIAPGIDIRADFDPDELEPAEYITEGLEPPKCGYCKGDSWECNSSKNPHSKCIKSRCPLELYAKPKTAEQ